MLVLTIAILLAAAVSTEVGATTATTPSLRQQGLCPTTNQYQCMTCPELYEARDLLKTDSFVGSAHEATFGPPEHWCFACDNFNELFKDWPTVLTIDLSCWNPSGVTQWFKTFYNMSFTSTYQPYIMKLTIHAAVQVTLLDGIHPVLK